MQLTLPTLVSLISLPLLTLAQSAPRCVPNDVPCFVSQAQYTVLATVIKTNIGEGDPVLGTLGLPENYNATMLIQCVFASTDPKMNDGQNILNREVLVTGFGQPKRGCPNQSGPVAAVNASGIFFLHVANSPPRGTTPILRVFDICTGGVAFDSANLAEVGRVMTDSPQLGFYGAARGDSRCQSQPGVPSAVPTPSALASGAPNPTATLALPSNNNSNAAGELKWGVAALVGAFVMAVGVVVM